VVATPDRSGAIGAARDGVAMNANIKAAKATATAVRIIGALLWGTWVEGMIEITGASVAVTQTVGKLKRGLRA